MWSRFARLWSKDRRRAKRHASFLLVAHYWDGASPAPRQVRDVGFGGMYLETEDQWYPNTLIKMTLTRSDKAKGEPDRSIAVIARVLRAGTDGVAFAFILPSSMQAVDADSDFHQQADLKTVKKFLLRLQTDSGSTVTQ
jgi:endo-alpha-1,4-polygalactosaminidase (GH114 family)